MWTESLTLKIEILQKDNHTDHIVYDETGYSYDEMNTNYLLESYFEDCINKLHKLWLSDNPDINFPLYYDEKGKRNFCSRYYPIYIANVMSKSLDKIILVSSLTMRKAYTAFSHQIMLSHPLENENINKIKPVFNINTYNFEELSQLMGLFIKVTDNDIPLAKRSISQNIDRAGKYILICPHNIIVFIKRLIDENALSDLIDFYKNVIQGIRVENEEIDDGISEKDIFDHAYEIILKLVLYHELGHLVFSFGGMKNKTPERTADEETKANWFASVMSDFHENEFMKTLVKFQPRRYRNLIQGVGMKGQSLTKIVKEYEKYNDAVSKFFWRN